MTRRAAVALMGRDLSAAQEELLVKHGITKVGLLFDGDHPGRFAAGVIVPRLTRRFYVRDIELADGEQPDTLTPERLREVLDAIVL
jgi:DNA primase